MDTINVKDPYSILGIPFQATPDEIKSAYRAKALQWHPDKHQENQAEWQNKFQLLQKAYTCLSDTTKRHVYDATGDWEGDPKDWDDDDDGFYGIPGSMNSHVIFMTTPMGNNLFEMFGQIDPNKGIESMFNGGIESLLQGFAGNMGNNNKKNLGDLFGKIFEPLKEKAKETMERMQTENKKLESEYEKWQTNKQKVRESQPKIYSVFVKLTELWNYPSEKPRKKRITIQESKDVIKVILGVQSIQDYIVQIEEPKDNLSEGWGWFWTTSINQVEGILKHQHSSWTLQGFKSIENEWVIYWTNEFDNMRIIWKGIGNKPDILEIGDELPEWVKDSCLGGSFYWKRPIHHSDKEEVIWNRLHWHPHPEIRERGNGWLIPNQGVWYNQGRIGEEEKIVRSSLWIPLPILPKQKEWKKHVYEMDIEDVVLDETFTFL